MANRWAPGILVPVDTTAALQIIDDALAAIDEFDALYRQTSGKTGEAFQRLWGESLRVEQTRVLPQLELARQIASHIGADILSIANPPDKAMYNSHPFGPNRAALVVLRTRLAERDRMAAILGPTGPQLSTSNLHPAIWHSAAHLFDGGHYRQAVQTAGQALESHLQEISGPSLSGQDLAKLFAATGAGPRLHFSDLEPDGKTYASARDGAASLIRGAMMGIRNLVSHPEWPDPTETEALEMLAVMSYVVHLVDRASKVD